LMLRVGTSATGKLCSQFGFFSGAVDLRLLQ
jgi:hypothetical protein